MEELIREKLEAYAPQPPEYIWNAVQAGIASQQRRNILRRRLFSALLMLLLLLVSIWFLIPNEDTMDKTPINVDIIATDVVKLDSTLILGVYQESEPIRIINRPEERTEMKESDKLSISSLAVNNSVDNLDKNHPVQEISYQDKQLFPRLNTYSSVEQSRGFMPGDEYRETEQTEMTYRYLSSLVNLCSSDPLVSHNLNTYSFVGSSLTNDNTIRKPSENGKWDILLAIAPELTTTTFDSITVLNSFSVTAEPIWYFKERWFVRFGVGFSLNRDRGFSRIEYVSKDLMGSYDDVYEVTFDTLAGQVIPTYHTKTVEVYDSITHLVISEVTARYLYFQLPLTVGYSKKIKDNPLSWHVFGGPVFQYRLSSVMDEPYPKGQIIEILNLQNRMPLRSNLYVQLWFGAGLQYHLNDRLSLSMEPMFHYYFNDVFKKSGYNVPISAFSLRVGTKIRLK